MIMRILSSILVASAPFVAWAQNYDGTRLGNPVARIMKPGDLIDLLITIIQFLGGPVVVLGIIYAGYNLVTAQGEERKLDTGKRALLWVIVGAAIILGATIIKNVVGKTFTDIFGT